MSTCKWSARVTATFQRSKICFLWSKKAIYMVFYGLQKPIFMVFKNTVLLFFCMGFNLNFNIIFSMYIKVKRELVLSEWHPIFCKRHLVGLLLLCALWSVDKEKKSEIPDFRGNVLTE
jgi:hypothetical protein